MARPRLAPDLSRPALEGLSFEPSMTKNRRIVLASRPKGEPADENFRLEPALAEPEGARLLLAAVPGIAFDVHLHVRTHGTGGGFWPAPRRGTLPV